jgi:Na+/H+ antiporter
MHAASTALILLFITALCAPLSRVIRLPPPLLQIGLGVGASMLGLQVRLDPAVFMLLFVPPLLFSDAFLMPMREFRQLHGVILGLAIGLVLFATLGCGLFVHWLIPAVPLAACFALAAVLSPTDPVAVGGMLEGRNVPQRFQHILSGEALLNDASGLVCFKFAAAAAMTGSFSILHAAGSFVLVSAGGLATGAALALALATFERWLLARGFDHAPTFVSLSALLPFAAYLAAEHLETSGILAAVAAGLTVRRGRVYGLMRTETRLGATATWEMLTFTFNGMIFVLLGLQLPTIVAGGIALMHRVQVPVWHLPLAVVEVTLVLVLLRLIWVHGTVLVRGLLQRGKAGAVSERGAGKASARLILAMAVAGVRGAITLAAVLSLQEDFPARALLVTLAAGVILCSLLLATTTLPALLRGIEKNSVDHVAVETDRARLALARTAAAHVEAEAHQADREHRQVLEALLEEMRAKEQRLHIALEDGPEEDRADKISALRRQRLEAALRLRMLRAERDSLADMNRGGTISDDVERLLMRELDHQEEVVLATARSLPRELAKTASRDGARAGSGRRAKATG